MRHARLLAAALLAIALLLAGCSGTKAEAPKAEAKAEAPADKFPVTVTDDLDRSVTVSKKPERIVSLAPANTEIVAALGLLPALTGVTTYDDYPAEVTKLPKVGDFMSPNLEAIAAAKPDLVLVTGGVQMETITKLEGLGAVVLAVDPVDIEETYAAIGTVGKVTGTSAKAAEVVDGMKAEIEDIRSKCASGAAVTAFVEIAQNPLYTAGTDTLFDDMIRTANGRNVVTQPGFVGYSLEQLLKDDPQVYMATKGSMSDPAGLGKRPGYDKLSAVKASRVTVLDDNLVSRPGPRIAQGLLQIAKALHPESFE